MEAHQYKIAIINPFRPDGLARTIFDGLLALNQAGSTIDFKLSSQFDYDLPLAEYCLVRDQFVNFAKSADLIFLIWGKDGTDLALAELINCWDKTIYLDGSEVGKNLRYDFKIQRDILAGTYQQAGCINQELLAKCAGYFRREKPYWSGIEALPFGIETRYLSFKPTDLVKDIDFFCIFGQDEYPLMRRYAREFVKKYCAENGFTCATAPTNNQTEFYQLLARSKVGVSIRFWEILGNNSLLLTEKIDIFEPDSQKLVYRRIYQFSNLFDFQTQLEKIGAFLRTDYLGLDLGPEYESILADHSTSARVRQIIEFAKQQKII